jgi:hypothetical protein
MLTYQGNVITKHTDVNNWIGVYDTSSWKLLVEPTDMYLNVNPYNPSGVGTNLDAFVIPCKPSVRPEWLIGNNRVEIRGRVSGTNIEYSGNLASAYANIQIPREDKYNKYLLIDLYGWYYCEGKGRYNVRLEDGNLQLKLTSAGPTIYDVTFTPSNIVTTPANYYQNDTNTIKYNQTSYSQTFVPDAFVNFKCLIDKVHNKVYNLVQTSPLVYNPYEDIDKVTWEYVGNLNPNNTYYSRLFNGNGAIYLSAITGSFHTGISGWWQSGMTWSKLTISGCNKSNINLNVR